MVLTVKDNSGNTVVDSSGNIVVASDGYIFIAVPKSSLGISSYSPYTALDTLEIIPVAELEISSYAPSILLSYTNPLPTSLGVACYDSNQDFIEHKMVNHYVNTETTLSQDLENGDVVVYLTSTTNWTDSSATYKKHIAFWGAESSYTDYTYTRSTANYTLVDDYDTNTLTLASPWDGDTVVSGTAVANSYEGNIYNYIVISDEEAPDNWTKYTGTIGGGWEINESVGDFRYGTEYIKVVFLLNFDSEDSTIVDGVSFYNKTNNQQIIYETQDNKIVTDQGVSKFQKFKEDDTLSNVSFNDDGSLSVVNQIIED